MTTEDDFRVVLDRHPDDHHTRLVFADWLEERGDPRAEGYRALGMLRLYAFKGTVYFAFADFVSEIGDERGLPDRSNLPRDWFLAASEDDKGRKVFGHSSGEWIPFGSAREAEDAAARAFAKLPAARRAELLAGA